MRTGPFFAECHGIFCAELSTSSCAGVGPRQHLADIIRRSSSSVTEQWVLQKCWAHKKLIWTRLETLRRSWLPPVSVKARTHGHCVGLTYCQSSWSRLYKSGQTNRIIQNDSYFNWDTIYHAKKGIFPLWPQQEVHHLRSIYHIKMKLSLWQFSHRYHFTLCSSVWALLSFDYSVNVV